ncbi:hypothetical protein MLPF_1432 [Mycobacterium lepromatosis]|nr:hypothetical protein MLPF_1432 [Mycobacterium lepromatosis]
MLGIPVRLGRVPNAIPKLPAPMIAVLMLLSCAVLYGPVRAALPAKDLSNHLGLKL